MFKFGEPIKPREPVRVAEAEQPRDYDDVPKYDEKFFRKVIDDLSREYRKSFEE